jgi:hypothetical protein
MEAVRLVTPAHSPQVYDFIPQVPRHAAPRRGLGSGSQERVPAAFRPRRDIKGQKYSALSRKENLPLDSERELFDRLIEIFQDKRETERPMSHLP